MTETPAAIVNVTARVRAMANTRKAVLLPVLGLLLTTACAAPPATQATLPLPQPPQLANPASQHCVAQGGAHTPARRPDGGQYGVCVFEDNRQCEEWALLRGQCAAGGIRVAGFATDAARYCGITGGRYTITGRSGATDEEGTCTVPDGRTCDAHALYRGRCPDVALK